MRVSMPTGSPSRGGTIATDVCPPGGATSSQRSLSPYGTSVRVSNPSFSVKNSSDRSWSVTGTITVPISLICVLSANSKPPVIDFRPVRP
jgi:hypothetical protein